MILTPNYERRIVLVEQRPKPRADGIYEIRLQPAASFTAVAQRAVTTDRSKTAK